jgi:GNAT superfamily N-acetyltransferase
MAPMKLPVIHSQTRLSEADYTRHYHKFLHELALAASDETELSCGTAICNPELSDLDSVNCVVDAALTGDTTAQEAIVTVDAFFADRGVWCRRWVLNPSSPPQQTEPLAAALRAAGFYERAQTIFRLPYIQPGDEAVNDGTSRPLQVLPGRAALRHVRGLAIERAGGDAQAQWAQWAVLRLDDPRYESLVAMVDGQPVARVGVLTLGEIGLIDDLYVQPSARGMGIGGRLMNRAIDICARSQFKEVLMGTREGCSAEAGFARAVGFEPVGRFVEYVQPQQGR